MTTEIANEVNVNQLMIEYAVQEVYLLADHTRVGNNSSFTSCGIEMVKNLITDEAASEEELELMRAGRERLSGEKKRLLTGESARKIRERERRSGTGMNGNNKQKQ